jgi:hypothetical protein
MSRHVHYDRLHAEQALNYVTEMFAWRTAEVGQFPLDGFESGKLGTAIPAGARVRIKASVNVDDRLAADTGQFGNPESRTAAQAKAYNEARWIAKGIQAFGMVVGDNSGSESRLKLSNTHKEGRGAVWSLDQDALRTLPFIDDWEVVARNYDPPTW